eukprot:6201940-Pleurochrysis_carterae.AAC.3
MASRASSQTARILRSSRQNLSIVYSCRFTRALRLLRMNRGVFFLAIDPSRLSQTALAQAERLFSAMQRDEGVRLPADSRYRARAAAAEHGVQVDAVLAEECFGADFVRADAGPVVPVGLV